MIGLFALSGDPIHFGHIDIILKASEQCDHLYVVVNDNDEKRGKYLFNLDERIEMVRRAVSHISNVEVIYPVTPVLTDTYLQYNVDVLFRGIRNVKDIEYENGMLVYFKKILSTIQVKFINSSYQFNDVSSTVVKNFAHHHLDIIDFVPLFVKQALEKKLHNQFKIAITGQIAVGKTWVAQQLAKQHNGHHINIDDLIRELYIDPAPGPECMRQKIIEMCRFEGVDITMNGKFDRKKLASCIFNPAYRHIKQSVEQQTKPFVEMAYRNRLRNCTGLIVVEWAQLAQMNMTGWTNNNVVLVEAPEHAKLAGIREINESELQLITGQQWSASQISEAIHRQIYIYEFGRLVVYKNEFATQPNGIIEKFIQSSK